MDTRYISRTNNKSDEILIKSYDQREGSDVNHIYEYTPLNIKLNEKIINIIMRNLINYRELIDYKSVIYVIRRKQECLYKFIEINSSFARKKLELEEYTNDETFNALYKKLYKDVPPTQIPTYSKIIVPVAYLLIDKNKNIHSITVDSEFITAFNDNKFIISVNELDDFIIPLGEYIYWIDMMYDSVRQCFYTGDKVPKDLLQIISINKPSFSDYTKIFYNNFLHTKYIEDIIKSINKQKEDIFRDLGVTITNEEFTYVTRKMIKKTMLKDRKKQLMNELKALEEIDSDSD